MVGVCVCAFFCVYVALYLGRDLATDHSSKESYRLYIDPKKNEKHRHRESTVQEERI
jgi:hypothetical protein